MMTPEPVILGPDATVADALAHVRDPDLPVSLAAMVYVCRQPLETPTGRLLGVRPHPAPAARAARRPWSRRRSTTMSTRCGPRPRSTRWRRYLATYNLVAAPVVDDEGRLLGAVTVDDLLDHMLPENWRDQDRLRRGTQAVAPWLTRAATASTPRPRSAARWCAARPTTPTRSASSPSSSPASWAPPGS